MTQARTIQVEYDPVTGCYSLVTHVAEWDSMKRFAAHFKRLRPQVARIEADCAEKKRPALDWNKPANVDRFPGFVVTSGKALGAGPNDWMGSSPLQRMSQEGDQMHGSAFLRKG